MKKFVYEKILKYEETDWWYRGVRKAILFYLHKFTLQKNAKLLDIGCGTGYLMKTLEKKWQVYGIDISPYAVKMAKSRGLENIQRGSIESIPFPDNFFDVALAMDVIEHVKNDTQALQEIYRVLKPGGIIIINTPAYKFLWGFHDKSAKHFRRYTTKNLAKKISSVNLKIVKMTYLNFLLFPIALLYRFIFGNHFSENKTDVGSVPKFLTLIFYKIFSLESYLLRIMDLPYGLSVSAVAQKPILKAKNTNVDNKESNLKQSVSNVHN